MTDTQKQISSDKTVLDNVDLTYLKRLCRERIARLKDCMAVFIRTITHDPDLQMSQAGQQYLRYFVKELDHLDDVDWSDLETLLQVKHNVVQIGAVCTACHQWLAGRLAGDESGVAVKIRG